MTTTGRITVRVRYDECDPMGVAHHAAYPVWFEMGRTELLRETGRSYRDLEALGVMLAVVALEVRYRRPARYDDEVTVVTTVTRTTRAKIAHAYELLRNGERLATATTTIACLDRDGRPQALPEFLAGS